MNNLESYPPILRQLSHHQKQLPPNQKPFEENNLIQDDLDPIPVIDLECLDNEIKKLEEACKDWGLFRLVNHGVPLTLLKQLQELPKQLFSMPFESKQASCSATPITYFWGTPALTPSGTTLTTRDPQNINWVEGFNVPLSQLSNFNSQNPMLESIRHLLMEYERHVSRMAIRIYEGIVKKLEWNLKGTKSYLSTKTGTVRVYRYPQSHDINIGWGMEAHTDSSVLSILNLDDQVTGLEVLKDDHWLTVKPISNTFIVNLGDIMQAMSDDRYKSVTHRVKVNKHGERISVCYFVYPEEDVVIESSKYKSFTYNEFRAQVQQDIKTIGYKVGLARFRQNEDF
ncbi:hypothetical protein RJT34_12603 [Clitoria ternatea]|uniref:Fe2OG dioxygenase domain-containing protein n=1 Tax=Clitoria ternatea TaxID=43366 RepID=A0AAN9PKN5_CLITE